MKKVLLIVLLMFGMAVILHAQDSGESDDEKEKKNGLGGQVRVGYSFPILSGFMEYDKEDTGESVVYGLMKVALAFAFSSVAVGGGVQYEVVPHIFVPGVYFDVNFNFFSWAIMSIFEKSFVMLQIGFRVYNQFSVSFFGFEPFFGGNFVYLKYGGSIMPVLLMQGGFFINLGRFTFEYGYHFPTKRYANEGFAFTGLHRITFGGIVWKK